MGASSKAEVKDTIGADREWTKECDSEGPVASNGKESRGGSAQEQNKKEGNTLMLIFDTMFSFTQRPEGRPYIKLEILQL